MDQDNIQRILGISASQKREIPNISKHFELSKKRGNKSLLADILGSAENSGEFIEELIPTEEPSVVRDSTQEVVQKPTQLPELPEIIKQQLSNTQEFGNQNQMKVPQYVEQQIQNIAVTDFVEPQPIAQRIIEKQFQKIEEQRQLHKEIEDFGQETSGPFVVEIEPEQQLIIDEDQIEIVSEKQANQQEYTKEPIVAQQKKTKNSFLMQKYNQIVGKINPKKLVPVDKPIDFVETKEQLLDAVKHIPDAGKDTALINVELKPAKTEKTKEGYFKTKVNIKTEGIPSLINRVASMVKSGTNGVIKPRVCDLRVIGNTNKTQLRSFPHKLSKYTVVFKPDPKKMKVNKGTRFMISIPQDFKTSGNLLVYMQESRWKNIIEIDTNLFTDDTALVSYIANRIIEFYYVGSKIADMKLGRRGINNPLMEVINAIGKVGGYKIKPYLKDNHLIMVDLHSKSANNQWLFVRLVELSPDSFNVLAKNDIEKDWEFNVMGRAVNKSWLVDNIAEVLQKTYDRDWTDELGSKDDEYMDFMYKYGKLKHYQLKKAMLEIRDVIDLGNSNVSIIDTVSAKDAQALLKNDYDMEAILGKTGDFDWVLSYLGQEVIGGDKRKGEEYITSDEYYQKYSVSDRRQYQKRDKTVLAKEGKKRNYNARIYMFQLEYKSKKFENVYRAVKFSDVRDATKFLTDNPEKVKSKY